MNAKDIIQGVTKRVVPKPVLNAAVRPMVRSVLSLAFGRKGYRINIGGQGMFRLSPDFVFGGWENFGDRHNGGFVPCIEACTEKSVFIDVGAHIGLHSLPVNSVLAPGGQVFAFEPSGGSYSYLRKHIAYNAIDNIHPYQLIVGDCSADAVVFYEHLDSSSPLGGGLTRRAKRPSDADSFTETTRPQISLDEFCAANNVAPDVIKIDVEGAEILMLRGAKQVLARHRPLLFLSVHPSHLEAMGQSVRELEALLREIGYEPHDTGGGPVNDLSFGEYLCVATTAAQCVSTS